MLIAITWRTAVTGSDHSELALEGLRMPAHARVALQIGETQYQNGFHGCSNLLTSIAC